MKIGLVAGESSGDLLGAGLVRELRRRYPEAIFEGIAGPEMLAAGCDQWEASEALAVFGLIEPLVMFLAYYACARSWSIDGGNRRQMCL